MIEIPSERSRNRLIIARRRPSLELDATLKRHRRNRSLHLRRSRNAQDGSMPNLDYSVFGGPRVAIEDKTFLLFGAILGLNAADQDD